MTVTSQLKKEIVIYAAAFLTTFVVGLSLKSIQKPLQFFGLAGLSEPSFSLLPQSGNFKTNEPLPIKVILDTNNQTVKNADLILSFDPSLAKIVSGPTAGPVFSKSSGKFPAPGGSLINWSGSGEFNGVGYLLSFTILPLKKGELKVGFDHAAIDTQPAKTQNAIFQID